MDLRTGTPVWIGTAQNHLNLSPLAADLRCEAVVLGGGVTGALAAYALVRDGLSVVLLDRGTIGRGSTAASTGLLQYEVDTPLSDLVRKVGREHAVHAYRRGLAAIDEIQKLTEELGDSCGFARRDSLYFATNCWHQRRLRREYDCRRECGFDIDFLTRLELAKLTSIQSPCAILSRGDAQLDPYRFTQRLVEAAMRMGLSRACEHAGARNRRTC